MSVCKQHEFEKQFPVGLPLNLRNADAELEIVTYSTQSPLSPDACKQATRQLRQQVEALQTAARASDPAARPAKKTRAQVRRDSQARKVRFQVSLAALAQEPAHVADVGVQIERARAALAALPHLFA